MSGTGLIFYLGPSRLNLLSEGTIEMLESLAQNAIDHHCPWQGSHRAWLGSEWTLPEERGPTEAEKRGKAGTD